MHPAALVCSLLLLMAALPEARAAAPLPRGHLWVYIGTYTARTSEGIYLFSLNPKTGELSPRGLAAPAKQPSFLAIHPNGRHLYAVNELTQFEGKPSGAVSAFAIDRATGRLEFLNQQPSEGGAPCHLVTDRKGRHLLVANYVGGNLVVLPIQKDGQIGPVRASARHSGRGANPQRQEAPHAHAAEIDPSGRYVAVADLGIDQVVVYRYDADDGDVKPVSTASVAPGAGPRHFAFHPKKPWAYANNELDSTVTAFRWNPRTGELQETATLSTLPKAVPGNTTAEIAVHPSGRFLYVSNRVHDSLAVFQIDATTGGLIPLEYVPTRGRIPRSFGIDPSGNWLIAANQESDTLAVFAIDQKTGRLTPSGNPISCPMPVSVQFLKP